MFWPIIFLQIILLDIILSGDNAVVIASEANVLPRTLRTTAIVAGISLALIARIALVSMAGLLIHVKLLSVAGGILLFWIAYRMVKHAAKPEEERKPRPTGDIVAAIFAIVIADVTMSLDNIVAIAGLSKGHPVAMVFGLGVSLTILGFGARFISDLLEKHRWLNWAGAAMVGWVGLTMVI